MSKTRYYSYRVSQDNNYANIFPYVGIVADCERKEIIKANKKYIVTKMEVQHVTADCIRQKCYLEIPVDFDLNKIRALQEAKTPCTFHFDIHTRSYGKTKANFLHCLAIIPKDERYRQFEQRISSDTYRTVLKGYEKDVDDDGYRYPYDY